MKVLGKILLTAGIIIMNSIMISILDTKNSILFLIGSVLAFGGYLVLNNLLYKKKN